MIESLPQEGPSAIVILPAPKRLLIVLINNKWWRCQWICSIPDTLKQNGNDAFGFLYRRMIPQMENGVLLDALNINDDFTDTISGT